MVNARTYFARMNNNRTHDSWLTEHHLIKGAEEFFRINEYSNIEYDTEFNQGSRRFSLAISACKKAEETGNDEFDHTLAGVARSKINDYDLQFFGYLESVLYDIMDNYEYTKLMLITDSLSYLSIINRDEVSVAIENMMNDGLNVLFLNQRFSYAFFERFDDMTKPILV
jgi:hypothetical protein